MFGRRRSLSTGLLIAVVTMDYLAVVLVYMTGHIYRATLADLLAAKLSDVLAGREWQSRVFVITGTGSRPLVNAFAQKGVAAIAKALQGRTRRHLLTHADD